MINQPNNRWKIYDASLQKYSISCQNIPFLAIDVEPPVADEVKPVENGAIWTEEGVEGVLFFNTSIELNIMQKN